MKRAPRTLMLTQKEADMLRAVVANLKDDDEIVMAVSGGREDMTVIGDAMLAVERVYRRHGRPFYLYKTPYSS